MSTLTLATKSEPKLDNRLIAGAAESLSWYPGSHRDSDSSAMNLRVLLETISRPLPEILDALKGHIRPVGRPERQPPFVAMVRHVILFDSRRSWSIILPSFDSGPQCSGPSIEAMQKAWTFRTVDGCLSVAVAFLPAVLAL